MATMFYTISGNFQITEVTLGDKTPFFKLLHNIVNVLIMVSTDATIGFVLY